MTEITTITLPDYDAETENFAEVATAAWIATNGGTDVTGRFPDNGELGNWCGDWQAPDGTVCRLVVNEMTKEIDAYELNVQFDLGEEIIHGGEHVWTGAEWLAETRDEDAIRVDILADIDDEDADGEFVTILGESI